MSRNWRIAFPLTFLIAIHLACLFGGFLAPNSALKQNRDLAWAPPTKIRFVDAQGRFHWRPFVYPLVQDPNQPGTYNELTTQASSLRLFVEGDKYHLIGIIPANLHLLGASPPADLFLLGTDAYGRDLLAQTLVGGRSSLFAGLLAGAIALTLATVFGTAAGYIGGRTDALLMRAAELFLALPWIYLLLAIRAFLPLTLSPSRAFLFVVILIGLLGWPIPARILRGVVKLSKEQPFVLASRSLGANETTLLFRHILPRAAPAMTTQAAILIPAFVLAEVTLSFVGLGFSTNLPSWGGILQEARTLHSLSNQRWMLSPAVLLLLTLISAFTLTQLTTTPRTNFPKLPR